jgi:death-on-curing protein
MREPVWLDLPSLHLLHDRQLELFGGRRGFRDEAAVEAALSEPLTAWITGRAADLETLAATYLHAIVRGRGYRDANRRSGLAAMLVFLQLNGRPVRAPQAELLALVTAAADGEVGVDQVATWLRGYDAPLPGG